tara:strand:- start:7110 stop:7289 length:180 start_codon:yes stop_codon:yes gene_type:complete
MPQYRYKTRITDDIVDAMEIIRNTGRMLQNQKIDANTVVQNLSLAFKKLDDAIECMRRE